MDYLSFAMSSLYGYLTNEETSLPSGYCLYRDNAYVNDMYMAIRYPNTSAGPKDAYNYFHSQVIFFIQYVITFLEIHGWFV